MPFHETTLPNGLRVIGELNDSARSVATGFFVKAGSRDESADVAGVSHFLEHMIFKGTPRRDALAVNRDFDRVGAKHNAQTSEEDTFYHVTCLPEYLPKAFDVLSDILRPSLREDDFETEKKVIIEEIRMYLDSPMSVAYEAAKAAHFGGAPARAEHPRHGRIDHRPARDQMRDYFARYYSPANIVLAFAGKSDWDRIVGLAEEHCGAWKGEPASRQAVPPRGTGAFRAILRAEDQQQTVIGMSRRPAPGERRPLRRRSSSATVLGDHTGTRLYWTLVDPGHADGAEVGYQDYNNAGVFFTFLSCEPDEAQENLGRIVDAYRNVDDRGDHRGRAGAGQEQGPRPQRPSERAADGPAGVAGLPVDVSPRVSVRGGRAGRLLGGHDRGHPPGARRAIRWCRRRSSRSGPTVDLHAA